MVFALGCHGDGGGCRIKALGPYPTLVKTVSLQPAWCHMLWCGYIIGGGSVTLNIFSAPKPGSLWGHLHC